MLIEKDFGWAESWSKVICETTCMLNIFVILIHMHIKDFLH